MDSTSRRQFLAASTLVGAAAISGELMAVESKSPAPTAKESLPKLVHHVFFWLKNPGSAEDRAKLIAGIKALSAIETVRAVHVGIPASTEKRDVVDNSYDVSELLCFDDVEGQNVYQVHPLHQKFVEDCSHLWAKVVVYDTLAV
jgi:hypothetical protein